MHQSTFILMIVFQVILGWPVSSPQIFSSICFRRQPLGVKVAQMSVLSCHPTNSVKAPKVTQKHWPQPAGPTSSFLHRPPDSWRTGHQSLHASSTKCHKWSHSM